MGCWNKTCGLSNLHIYAGTPVYVFVLEDKRTESNCYTTSLFSPLLLPFESVYNDYGGGENSTGPAFPYIIEALKEKLIELDIGENKYHDIAVKREIFDEVLFFEAVHEHRLFIGNWKNEKTPVTFTMFRKDIVDSILNCRAIEQYVGDGKGTGGWGNNYNFIKFSDIIATVRPLIEKFSSDRENGNRSYHMHMFDEYRNDFLAAEWIVPEHRFSRIVYIPDLISRLIDDGKLDEAEALMIEHIRGVFIERFMNDTRKTWIPGGHEGSQSSELDAHHLLATTIIQLVNKEKADYE